MTPLPSLLALPYVVLLLLLLLPNPTHAFGESFKLKGKLLHCAWQFETSYERCNMGVIDQTARYTGRTMPSLPPFLPPSLPPLLPFMSQLYHPLPAYTFSISFLTPELKLPLFSSLGVSALTAPSLPPSLLPQGGAIFPNHRVYKWAGRFPTQGHYFSITLYDDSGIHILGSYPDFALLPSRRKNPYREKVRWGREGGREGRGRNVPVCVSVMMLLVVFKLL